MNEKAARIRPAVWGTEEEDANCGFKYASERVICSMTKKAFRLPQSFFDDDAT
jgi:hypothetical protein